MSLCGGPTQPQPPAGNTTGRMVFCQKFQKEMPGLDAAPWPGELGQRIYDNISAEAWKIWEERMKMILNEYRLMPWQKEAQELVAEAHGGFLLRRRRGAAARLRSAAGQGLSRTTGIAGCDHRTRVDACASRTRLLGHPARRGARAKMNPR